MKVILAALASMAFMAGASADNGKIYSDYEKAVAECGTPMNVSPRYELINGRWTFVGYSCTGEVGAP